MNDLPSTLRYLRNVAGMAQATAAREAGIEPAMLSRFETGERAPTLATLETILAVYGMKVAIVPVATPTPEDTQVLARMAQAGQEVDDAVASLLYDPNAGSLMERMDVLVRLHRRFQQIVALVKKGQNDG